MPHFVVDRKLNKHHNLTQKMSCVREQAAIQSLVGLRGQKWRKVEEELQSAPQAPVEPPNGMYPGKLDDKGRLKIPASFLKYFADLKETKLFVTSLNRTTVQIYTNSGWRAKKTALMTAKGNARAAEGIILSAAYLGADVEIDVSGRVTFNSVLRQELKLDGQSLQLLATRDRLEVMPAAIFDERNRKAAATAEADMAELEAEGLL